MLHCMLDGGPRTLLQYLHPLPSTSYAALAARCLPSHMLHGIRRSCLQHAVRVPQAAGWQHSTVSSTARASTLQHGNQLTSSAAIPPMPVVYHPLFSAPQLAPNHRFPMQVFARIHQRLLSQGIIQHSQVHVPPALPTDYELALVHCPEYLTAFSSCTLDDQRVRRIGFGPTTRTQVLVDRTKSEVAGTLLTARLALQHGLACSTAGGTHHAFADAGSGFCILNDLAYTAHVLLKEGAVQRILILDLDVHQGDGTAAMCAGNPGIFTLSVHAASNFPARKQQSSLDVALPDGVTDEGYLSTVAEVLPDVLTSFKPQLVLYDAGVDIHEQDDLGRLSITDQGLMRRELLVLDSCLASGIPVAGYVGGGYDRDLDVLAERHMALHRAALRMWRDHSL